MAWLNLRVHEALRCEGASELANELALARVAGSAHDNVTKTQGTILGTIDECHGAERRIEGARKLLAGQHADSILGKMFLSLEDTQVFVLCPVAHSAWNREATEAHLLLWRVCEREQRASCRAFARGAERAAGPAHSGSAGSW